MRHIPSEFLNIPAWLNPVQPVPSKSTTQHVLTIRNSFLFSDDNLPYVVDILRASQLLKNAKTYVEIGTYDKGNLGFLSTILAPNAHIVDVDIVSRPDSTRKLSAFLRPSQTLSTIVGDSTDPDTAQLVVEALNGEFADGIFIDGNHIAEAVMADYSLYSSLVKPGGYIFFHDVYWNGNTQYNGASFALANIDRLSPVFVVFSDRPAHRFLPWMSRETVWGGVGILRK